MPSEALKNFNDGVRCYENILHSAGVHVNPLNTTTRQEIEERIEQLERAKNNTVHPEKVQKLNRLRNYLLEINYETQ